MSVRLKPSVANAAPYRQGKAAPPGGFKLSSNELPVAPSLRVRTAAGGQADSINRYPVGAAPELTAALSSYLGVPAERLIFGAGSVMILDSLILAVAGPGDEIVYPWRSFEAYPLLALRSGATAVEVPLTADHGHDLDAMADAITERTRAVIVCSPNNPTGTLVTADEWQAFLARVPNDVLVILDEAYIEFVDAADRIDGLQAQAAHDNVVTVRTFSKAWGLAGLRLGYVVGDPAIISAVRAVSIPLATSAAAQSAAIVSLQEAEVALAGAATIAARRDEWWDALGGADSGIPQPHGNFVWVPTVGLDADRIQVILDERGIVARQFPEGVRITVGEAEARDAVLDAVRAIGALG